MTTISKLQWFADPDGVHRLKELDGITEIELVPVRATVYLVELMHQVGAWQWHGGEASGILKTLDLAKAAAEQAVKELDGEA